MTPAEKYLSNLAPSEKHPYIEDCFKKRSGDVYVGLIKFRDGMWAIGSGFPGNYSVFHVTDFRKYKKCLGRKRMGTEKDYWFVDQPGMNKLVKVPLKTQAQIRAEELEYNRTSIHNFPYRLYNHFNLEDVKVQGQICRRSELSEEEIRTLEGLMTEKEIQERNKRLTRISYSVEEPSVEYPIRIRISGIDDGAAVKLYANIEDAMNDAKLLEGKTWMNCDDVFDLGFLRTD